MNIEGARADANKLKQFATQIQAAGKSANSTVTGSLDTNWNGPDSQRFIFTTWPAALKQLNAVVAQINAAAQQILTDANQQQSASA
jgi:uncharacterized protein YukE